MVPQSPLCVSALLLAIVLPTVQLLKHWICITISPDPRTLLQVGSKQHVHAIDGLENNILSKGISISGQVSQQHSSFLSFIITQLPTKSCYFDTF